MPTMRGWALLLVSGIAGSALAQGDAIYRCEDGNGGVLYANTPCPGGRVVALVASKPDPAARERLQRDLEAFERRHAAREAALVRERERREEARQRTMSDRQSEQTPSYAPAYGYYGYYAPFYPPPVQPPVKPRPRTPRQPSFLPVR
jgi:Domain of unknown function (DUF4124)